MDGLVSAMLASALVGALFAALALAGKLTHRLADHVVDRLYYVSYACTGLSAALFVVRGLFAGRAS